MLPLSGQDERQQAARLRETAEWLARAEREGPTPLPARLTPLSEDEAYAVQDAGIAFDKIGAWKVTVPTLAGVAPACAPLAVTGVLSSGATYTPRPRVTPEMEGEIAVEIGADLPPGEAPFSRSRVAAAIRATLPAIEILGSRFPDRKAALPLAVLADRQSNAGIVVGDGRPGWAPIDLAHARLRASVNGVAVAGADDGASAGAVLDALVWLANHAARRCGGLRQGQVVLTGARIRPFVVRPGDTVHIECAELGHVTLHIAAA